MTPQDARKILGLGPTDDISSSLVELGDAKDRIAAMVDRAPNEVLANRYRKGLEEFETALATLQAELKAADDASPLDPPVPETKVPQSSAGETADAKSVEAGDKVDLSKPEPPVQEVVPKVPEAKDLKPEPTTTTDFLKKTEALRSPATETNSKARDEKQVPSPAPTVVLGKAPAAASPASEVGEDVVEAAKPSRALTYFVWFLVLCVGTAGGVWLFLEDQKEKREQAMSQAALLERQGAEFIENRSWQEAADAFAKIESLLPGSEMAMRGRRSIEVGMAEEQTQFLGYWIGQASAELEAGRLDEAEAATRKVLDRFPDEEEAAAINLKIAAARETQALDAAIAAARDELNQRKFDAAIASAEKILATNPTDPDAKGIFDGARLAKAKAAADRQKAAGLFRKAAERDKGVFDQQALDWAREAASLDPDNSEISALLEKLSGYTRTLEVPGEFETLDEALASARDRDRIVVAAGTWKGPLVANVAVEIRGAGAGETIVECSPESGSAFTVGPDAKGVRVTGITFRHDAFAVGKDRFSVVLIRGGEATFSDCVFTRASGHGLAVIESGRSVVSRCKFIENGWNGVAAIGKGCALEVRDSEVISNFEHGIETWDGAAAVLVNNRCEGNSRNGIHADNRSASAEITGNRLIANREFGLVLDSAGDGQVTKNSARDNLLGGIVIRTAAQAVRVTTNEATANHGPGLVLEKGLPSASYLSNTLSKNSGKQLLAGVDFDVTVKPPVVEKAPAEPLVPPPGMKRTTPTEPSTAPPPRAKIIEEP